MAEEKKIPYTPGTVGSFIELYNIENPEALPTDLRNIIMQEYNPAEAWYLGLTEAGQISRLDPFVLLEYLDTFLRDGQNAALNYIIQNYPGGAPLRQWTIDASLAGHHDLSRYFYALAPLNMVNAEPLVEAVVQSNNIGLTQDLLRDGVDPHYVFSKAEELDSVPVMKLVGRILGYPEQEYKLMGIIRGEKFSLGRPIYGVGDPRQQNRGINCHHYQRSKLLRMAYEIGAPPEIEQSNRVQICRFIQEALREQGLLR